METRSQSSMGVPGRLAVVGAAYAFVVAGLTLVAFVWADPHAQWPRALDLEDLFFTAPVAGVLALVLGTIELVRGRRARPTLVVALALAVMGLLAFGFLLLGLMGAAGLLQNI